MKFKEVAVGQKFTLNDIEYVKINPVKVSCCRSVVAKNTTTGESIDVNQDQEVAVVQE